LKILSEISSPPQPFSGCHWTPSTNESFTFNRFNHPITRTPANLETVMDGTIGLMMAAVDFKSFYACYLI
jgi:hypothetical protein